MDIETPEVTDEKGTEVVLQETSHAISANSRVYNKYRTASDQNTGATQSASSPQRHKQGRSFERPAPISFFAVTPHLPSYSSHNFMDFSKAFDKPANKRFMHTVDKYGIQCNTEAWIKIFLSEGTQQIVVDGEVSGQVPITPGGLQGSVLGHVLFLLFVNDSLEGVTSNTKLLANDTIIYTSPSKSLDPRDHWHPTTQLMAKIASPWLQPSILESISPLTFSGTGTLMIQWPIMLNSPLNIFLGHGRLVVYISRSVQNTGTCYPRLDGFVRYTWAEDKS